MTLEQASLEALRAAEQGDLHALAQALEARARALDRGEQPTEGVHAAGELAAGFLREILRETGAASARLDQLRRAVAGTPPAGGLEISI